MNLFIGGNFINTFSNKVDILQLIRQVTEEEDTIQSEVLDVIEREHGDEYDDLENADDKYATIQDDVLYVDGATAILVFKDLFDNDYDELIARIAQQIDNYQGGVLKLQANGFPEESIAVEKPSDFEIPFNDPPATAPGFTVPKGPALPAAALFESYPSWMQEPSVQEAAVAAGIRSLPVLKFAGKAIPVLQAEDGEVLFNLHGLYFAAYNIDHDQAYLHQVILRNRLALDLLQEDIRLEGQDVFAGVSTIATLHGELSPSVEFSSIVSEIIQIYEDCLDEENVKRTSVEIDLFGNLQ